MNILRFGNKIISYNVAYFDPASLPIHGQRLCEALERMGALPKGKIGFVDLIQVSDYGSRAGRLLHIDPYQIIHKELIKAARSAGLTHLVGQTREFPHPNSSALAVHKLHGWRDTGTSLLYPTREGLSGWEYSMGRVITLDLSREL